MLFLSLSEGLLLLPVELSSPCLSLPSQTPLSPCHPSPLGPGQTAPPPLPYPWLQGYFAFRHFRALVNILAHGSKMILKMQAKPSICWCMGGGGSSGDGGKLLPEMVVLTPPALEEQGRS